jgi:hypothetical protein
MITVRAAKDSECSVRPRIVHTHQRASRTLEERHESCHWRHSFKNEGPAHFEQALEFLE